MLVTEKIFDESYYATEQLLEEIWQHEQLIGNLFFEKKVICGKEDKIIVLII